MGFLFDDLFIWASKIVFVESLQQDLIFEKEETIKSERNISNGLSTAGTTALLYQRTLTYLNFGPNSSMREQQSVWKTNNDDLVMS